MLGGSKLPNFRPKAEFIPKNIQFDVRKRETFQEEHNYVTLTFYCTEFFLMLFCNFVSVENREGALPSSWPVNFIAAWLIFCRHGRFVNSREFWRRKIRRVWVKICNHPSNPSSTLFKKAIERTSLREFQQGRDWHRLDQTLRICAFKRSLKHR